MKTTTLLAGLLLSTIWLASPGCGTVDDPGPDGPLDGGAKDGEAEPWNDGGADPTDGSEEPANEGTPDSERTTVLAASYAARFVMSSITQAPVIGETQNLTISLMRYDLRPGAAGEFLMDQTICSIDQESSSNLVRIVLPDAFVESLPPLTRILRLLPTNDPSSFQVELVRNLEVRGARLADPENDPLPVSSDDPAVFDQDGDGNPGLTVRVQGLINGEIYLVQRAWDQGQALYDSRNSNGAIQGLLTWDQEQSILGADNPLLESANPTWVDPLAENSWFKLVPIDPTMSCERLKQIEDTLFE